MPNLAELLQNAKKQTAEQEADAKQSAFASLKDSLGSVGKSNLSSSSSVKAVSSTVAGTTNDSQQTAAEDADSGLPQIPQETSSAALFSDQQPTAFSEETVQQIRAALNLLRENLKNPDVVAESTRLILTEINQHPDLRNILLPEDCGVMVQALRESYGVAISKKQERKRKVTATQQKVDEVLNDLADLDLGNIG